MKDLDYTRFLFPYLLWRNLKQRQSVPRRESWDPLPRHKVPLEDDFHATLLKQFPSLSHLVFIPVPSTTEDPGVGRDSEIEAKRVDLTVCYTPARTSINVPGSRRLAAFHSRHIARSGQPILLGTCIYSRGRTCLLGSFRVKQFCCQQPLLMAMAIERGKIKLRRHVEGKESSH